ncbi:hypothetical protein BKA62DRAFT_771797 [Auriculariales sp. MPI-PUGE-AT-0066]|nr:hypothetical protein BKA62DRAFT_771797 [Auriculariales sp. MPI-PUGE-AT-0066]
MSLDSVLVTSRGLCQIACLAWFIYDYFLTLDDEIEHIWFRKFNLTSGLYFSSRILSFVMLIIGAVGATRTYELSPAQCSIFHWVEGIGSMIIFVNTQLVLQYRLWAIYDRSMKILLLNGALFVVECAAAITICSMFYAKPSQASGTMALPHSDMGGESCITAPPMQWHLSSSAVNTFLVYELWLVALAVIRTVQTRRLLNISGQRSLTEVVAYDSLIYFVLIVMSVLAVILVWIFAPVYPGFAAICFTRAAGGIGASRLILHMRAEAKARKEQTFSQPECIGVSIQLSSSPDNGTMRLVRARPSLANTDSPRPSVTSLNSLHQQRPSITSLVSASVLVSCAAASPVTMRGTSPPKHASALPPV